MCGKSGCIRAKVVVFGQSEYFRGRWLYLSKNGCVRTKLVVFGQKWLFS